MQDIKEYWIDKNQRAEIAKNHTKLMDEKYKNEIDSCAQNTVFYAEHDCDKVVPTKKFDAYNIILLDEDAVRCVLNCKDKTGVTVLNFSSYKFPGGGFLKGSCAQEECLCHESYLYNVLKTFTPVFYDWNENHKNKALYLNRGLFSHNVRFERDDETAFANVITCAAPNYATASKYCNVSRKENSVVLKSRIKFLLSMAYKEDTKVLILGAYGCGVFGQNPEEVARIFKDYLLGEFQNSFEQIIFAIPKSKNGNYDAFERVIFDGNIMI